MRDEPTATHEIADEAPRAATNEYDRTIAHGLAVEFRLNLDQAAQLAQALANTRWAGFCAGLTEGINCETCYPGEPCKRHGAR